MALYHMRPLEVQAVQFQSGKPKAIKEFCAEAVPRKDRNHVEFFTVPVTLQNFHKPLRHSWTVPHLMPTDWLVLQEDKWHVYDNESFKATFTD